MGGRFTWHRNCRGNRVVAKKLDRGLANLQWRLEFPEAYVEVLSRLHSDHNPILLHLGGLPQLRGSRPFRFEAAWIVHDSYHRLVADAWQEKKDRPVAALNKVKEESIHWNREVFGNIFNKKRNIEARLKGIHRSLVLV